MAFTNTPSEGVPFYRGIAPVVPEPDNTAAEIISRGTATGVNAFVQMALAKERNALAQQEMLQRADLAANDLEYRREALQQQHDLGLSGQQLQYDIAFRNNDLQRELLEAHIDVYDSQADVNKNRIEQWKNGMMTASQSVLEMGKINRKLNQQADPDLRAAENPELQATDQIAFADLVESLHGQWANAPSGSGIPQRLKALETIANQQKSDIVLNGERQKMSNRMILRRLRSQETYDETYQGLKAAGHIMEEGPAFDYGHPVDSIWNKVLGKGIKDKPSPTAEKLLRSAKEFDPTKVQSRVGPDVPRSAVDLRAQGAMLFGQPGGDASATPPPAEENETDQLISQAKLAISMGKDPAVVRDILAKQGIDPDTIDLEE